MSRIDAVFDASAAASCLSESLSKTLHGLGAVNHKPRLRIGLISHIIAASVIVYVLVGVRIATRLSRYRNDTVTQGLVQTMFGGETFRFPLSLPA